MAVRRRVDPVPENPGPSTEEESNGHSTDHDDVAETKQVSRPDLPCHKSRESLLSSDSGFQNYRGLLNNCIILLVLSNYQNIITNFIKYGILVNPMRLGSETISTHWTLWILLLTSYTFPLALLQVEKLRAKDYLSESFMRIFYGLYFTLLLLLPALYSYFVGAGPAYSFVTLFWYTILWLKLVSYVQVNSWCRKSKLKREEDSAAGLVRYPDNLNLKDMVYFLCAPTLCYELNFPRNKSRRIIFILRRLLESIFILNVNMAIMQQWIMPTALHSLAPINEMDWAGMVERVLLLALPNHLFWILGFYLLFHSVMNLLGELLCFSDRRFYDDWWNAHSIMDFWRAWNIPVHRWASRHIYWPLKKMGCNSFVAQMAVFLLSAFFHEYLVSLPLRMIRPWAFAGMASQIPLGVLTSLPFARGQIGNVIVWVSIVLGQPVAIMMYLHDYYWLNWSGDQTLL